MCHALATPSIRSQDWAVFMSNIATFIFGLGLTCTFALGACSSDFVDAAKLVDDLCRCGDYACHEKARKKLDEAITDEMDQKLATERPKDWERLRARRTECTERAAGNPNWKAEQNR
jgi:xanthine dehydrogenase iron-sulfur cluster and FAD-binding subunit A